MGCRILSLLEGMRSTQDRAEIPLAAIACGKRATPKSMLGSKALPHHFVGFCIFYFFCNVSLFAGDTEIEDVELKELLAQPIKRKSRRRRKKKSKKWAASWKHFFARSMCWCVQDICSSFSSRQLAVFKLRACCRVNLFHSFVMRTPFQKHFVLLSGFPIPWVFYGLIVFSPKRLMWFVASGWCDVVIQSNWLKFAVSISVGLCILALRLQLRSSCLCVTWPLYTVNEQTAIRNCECLVSKYLQNANSWWILLWFLETVIRRSCTAIMVKCICKLV